MNASTKTMLIAAFMVVAVAAAVFVPVDESDGDIANVYEGDVSLPMGDMHMLYVTFDEPVIGNITFNVTGDNGYHKSGAYNATALTDSANMQLDGPLAEGTYSITATVGGSVYTYTYTVGNTEPGEVTLTGIEVTTQPAKTEYTAGESFDAAGMVVMASYSEGDPKDVTADVEIIGGDNLAAGTTSVTVSYTENGATETVQVPNTVKAAETGPADPDRQFPNVITLNDGTVIDGRSSIHAGYYQEVIVDGDVTVIAGGSLTIDGKLTIAEGATLTLEEGAIVSVSGTGVVDIQGTMVVQSGTETKPTFTYGGCSMSVAGSVYLEGYYSYSGAGTGMEISGLFEIGNEATAQLNGATVAAGGELVIYGAANLGSTVNNYGTITIDSQGVPTLDGMGIIANGTVDMTIEMKADASVEFINAYGTVTVTDAGLQFDGSRNYPGIDAVNDNQIVLTNIAGVTISETLAIAQDGDESVNGGYVGTNTMYIAGTASQAVDYMYSSGIDSSIDIDAVGTYSDVEIAEDLVLTQNVPMNVNADLTVSANLTATDMIVEGDVSSAPITVTGEVTVTGKVTTVNSGFTMQQGGIVNAATYKTSGAPNYTIYTTLETALTDGATQITLLGDNSVLGQATIPVGTTVTVSDGATLTIAPEASMTIASDGSRSGRVQINTTYDYSIRVEGTLVAEDFAKCGIRNATAVLSDTSKTVDGARTYTGLYNALETAADGDVIVITKDQGGTAPEGVSLDVTVDQDITVAAGVTLQVPNNQVVNVSAGSTVTVDGTLEVTGTGAYTMAPPVLDADGNVDTPAGATVVNGMMKYADDAQKDYYSQYIVGAYFGYDGTNAIAPLASVPAIAADVESDVELYGAMELGAVDFSAYDGMGDLTTIYVMNDLTVDITIGNVALDAANDNAVLNGSIVMANGTVEVTNATGITAENSYDEIQDVTTSVIGGTVTAVQDQEAEGVETASVVIGGEIVSSASTGANVTFDVPVGATASMVGGELTAATVEGSMVIAGANVTFDSLTVTGTVSATENYGAIADRMYVGVTPEDFAMAGSGSVAGVTLSTAAGAVAYVSPNATVEGDLTQLRTTAYYVDDELYLTAYAQGADVQIGEVVLNVDNAYFVEWKYDNNGTPTGVGTNVVGFVPEVYADIIYDIYNVYVTVDSGIGSVAIDGNVLVNYIGNIYMTTAPLTAGQHTISYTLKSGYEGEATLSVMGDNATVSGLNFTLSGTLANPTPTNYEVTVQLSLSGTTASDTTIVIDNGNGDDGLGLTEILLIILVILIVIMAIIVALRLMRS